MPPAKINHKSLESNSEIGDLQSLEGIPPQKTRERNPGNDKGFIQAPFGIIPPKLRRFPELQKHVRKTGKELGDIFIPL